MYAAQGAAAPVWLVTSVLCRTSERGPNVAAEREVREPIVGLRCCRCDVVANCHNLYLLEQLLLGEGTTYYKPLFCSVRGNVQRPPHTTRFICPRGGSRAAKLSSTQNRQTMLYI